MRKGKILWFNLDKGFGIIESNDERFLIHESDILNFEKLKKLSRESKVKFKEDNSSQDISARRDLKRAKDVEVY
ncbi:MAG: cold-shock protein [Bdellovibrio sp.]